MRFTIAYDGPALARHRMPLLDLAPAMLSTARLVEDGVRLLYGPTAAVRIEVEADFKGGSFEFDILTGPVLTAAREIAFQLTREDVKLALEVLGLTGGGTYSVFALIKWLRNRRVKSVERAGDQARIVVHDGDNITVNINVANLAVNRTIREDAAGVIAPLLSPGITEFRAVSPGREPTVIRDDDVGSFEPPTLIQRELQDKVTEEVIEVVSPTFRDGNKWKFAQGDQSFHAAVLDQKFLAQVNRHEYTFGKGDALRVELRTRVTQSIDGLTAVREVVRVVEYIPPPSQGDIFADGGPTP